MVTDIRAGKRPSRPIYSSRSQLSRGPLWKVITTGWHDKPRRRCELSVIHHTFSSPIQHQQRGTILPRVASFFQFLQDSESETQNRVNEMNKVNLSTHTFPSESLYGLQRLENDAMSDRERLKLLNKLCKTCSRHRVIPKSMHIPDCSEDSVEVESGGFADVSRGIYEGRQVAIKVVRAYITSDLDVIRSVSVLPTLLCPSE